MALKQKENVSGYFHTVLNKNKGEVDYLKGFYPIKALGILFLSS
jgi:hypothetical protein